MPAAAHCACAECDAEFEATGPIGRVLGDGCPSCGGHDVTIVHVEYTYHDDTPLWIDADSA